jgi:hypothetical protein
VAFQVFNNRDEEHKKEKEKHFKVKYQLLASTLQPHVHPQKNGLSPTPARRSTGTPPGNCFLCSNPEHWAKACLNPRPPSKPCSSCGQWRHWKMDCPQGQNSQPLMLPTAPETPYHQLLQWGSLGPLAPPTNITESREPRVMETVAGQQITFVADPGATLSLLTSWSGPSEQSHTPVMGISGTNSFLRKTPKSSVLLAKLLSSVLF